MMLNTALELAGVACIAMFAATIYRPSAFLVTGVWLLLTALARDTSIKEAKTSDGASKPPRKT